jgi:hypothetical protein
MTIWFPVFVPELFQRFLAVAVRTPDFTLADFCPYPIPSITLVHQPGDTGRLVSQVVKLQNIRISYPTVSTNLCNQIFKEPLLILNDPLPFKGDSGLGIKTIVCLVCRILTRPAITLQPASIAGFLVECLLWLIHLTRGTNHEFE